MKGFRWSSFWYGGGGFLEGVVLFLEGGEYGGWGGFE